MLFGRFGDVPFSHRTMEVDELAQTLEPELGLGWHVFVVEAVDGENAVLGPLHRGADAREPRLLLRGRSYLAHGFCVARSLE